MFTAARPTPHTEPPANIKAITLFERRDLIVVCLLLLVRPDAECAAALKRDRPRFQSDSAHMRDDGTEPLPGGSSGSSALPPSEPSSCSGDLSGRPDRAR